MTLLGLVEEFLCALLRQLAETNLNCFVTIGCNGLHLSDGAGARFNDGDRYETSVIDENLGHTDLLAENCLFHCYTSFWYVRVTAWQLPVDKTVGSAP